VEEYKNDRLGLVLAYWALALALGRPLVSQTDFDYAAGEGIYGSLLNHITSGRYAKGMSQPAPDIACVSLRACETAKLPARSVSCLVHGGDGRYGAPLLLLDVRCTLHEVSRTDIMINNF
jgi:hypothetical protein